MNEQVNGKGDNNVNGYKPAKETEAAERLGCTVSTLRKWRSQGKGPAYVKVGRLVRYAEGDLQAYVDGNRKHLAEVSQ